MVVTDPDADRIDVRWEIRSETVDRKQGGEVEDEPKAHPGSLDEVRGLAVSFRVPEQEGGYRLITFVTDGKGHAATANIPFFVRR